MGRKYLDITGMTFGRMEVIGFYKAGYAGHPVKWLCKCSCGVVKAIEGTKLRQGEVQSCGCWRKESCRKIAYKHGYSNKKDLTYDAWRCMRARCLGNDLQHKKYYSKVKICKRWLSFKKFLTDMGIRKPGMTLHRLNNAKGYFKTNCVWANAKTQQRNTRRNVLIIYKGIEAPIAFWAEKYNFPYETFRQRIKRGWSIEKAITTSIQR